jgi:Na+-transporting methylmalonyl-CoA/oxaloacetate decarboxylase gamma subunit
MMTRHSTIWLARAVALFLAAALLAVLLQPGQARAFVVGTDFEKPKPEFSREGETVVAKLIPRAKSSSVTIDFRVSGGRLAAVRGVDFETAARPEVNEKNFKSALFDIQVDDVPVGGKIRVLILSSFFTRSTAFYVYNPRLQPPWTDAQAENIDHPDRVQELVVTVADGGPFDADGAADGRITLTGGPRDSFWSYALGTLFIRFFGIFIVLSVLMVGILFSGRIFQWLEGRKSRPGAVGAPTAGAAASEKPAASETRAAASAEVAAAIATALHLHIDRRRITQPQPLSSSSTNAWALSGRSRMMDERQQQARRTYRSRS